MILHAFSSGATALTGVEAISDGVPAFRHPRAKNAAETLAIMGVISVTMFLGISFLATHIQGITVSEEGSVVGQIAHAVFRGGLPFYIVQFFTSAILILAANTAYQDFPRLSSILARDRFMPRQFANRGDRLVFSNGVIVLGSLACLLIIAFEADLNRLIQLYVVGVFTAFTLSQTGMIRHWLKEKHKGDEAQKGWRRSIVINTMGAVSTFIVLCIVSFTKFVDGAWIVFVAVPIIMATFLSIHRHYTATMAQLKRHTVRPGDLGDNHVVLLVRDLDPPTAEALGYLRSFRPVEVHAVYPVDRRRGASGGPGSLADVRRWRPGPGTSGVPRRRPARSDAHVSEGHRSGAVGLRHRARARGDQGRPAHVPAAEPQARPAEGRTAPRAERGRHGRARRRGGGDAARASTRDR